MAQVQRTGRNGGRFSLDAEGFVIDATVEEIEATIDNPDLVPVTITFGADTAAVIYDVPLLASEDTQDFRLLMDVGGITLSEDVWSLFDADGAIPRDPGSLRIDLGGDIDIGQDLLDVNGWMAMQPTDTPDIEVGRVTLTDSGVSAAGAELTARADMLLDWTDMETIPQFPLPEGVATLRITGAQDLIATLADAGFLPPQQVQAARMGLAMFTEATEDGNVTEVEVRDGGQVFVNGVRMR